MSLLPKIIGLFGELLSEPGDEMSAEVTRTGRQVIKIKTKKGKKSAVRYPSTGKIVVTSVYDDDEEE